MNLYSHAKMDISGPKLSACVSANKHRRAIPAFSDLIHKPVAVSVSTPHVQKDSQQVL